MSLGKRMFWGGAALVAIPILVVGLFAYLSAAGALESQARQAVANTAERVGDLVNTFLESEVRLMHQVAGAYSTSGALIRIEKEGLQYSSFEILKLDTDLKAFMDKVGQGYSVVFVAGADGKIIADGVGGGYKNISVADRDYFKIASQGKVSVGQIVKNKKTGKPVVLVAVPVVYTTRDSKSRIIGVVAAAMRLDFWEQKVAGIKLGQTGYVYMIDQTGRIIAHPQADLVLEANITKMPGMEKISQAILSGKPGEGEYSFQGVPSVAGYAPVPVTGWVLIATQERADFLAPVYSLRNGVLLIGGAALALALILVVWFARRVSRPVQEVAEGLTSASQRVSQGADQLSAAEEALSRSAGQQAASLEETAASLEEMGAATKKNAENAQEAAGITWEMGKSITRVNKSISEVTQSMEEINQASQETAGIIKTVDEIAFQTNLLALNASVEAARAGEAGAGFAVVADEVRNLAMRAAEAARSTAGLIEGTLLKVKDGADLVERTAQAFQEVLDGAHRAGTLVEEIASASQEQAQGIEQVNLAVNKMDQETQQVAACAEQTASAAGEMQGQARDLEGFVADLIRAVGTSNGRRRGKGRAAPKQLTGSQEGADLA